MTHDVETTLNASVSSSPGNKKIWTTPVVQPLWGADAGAKASAVPTATAVCLHSVHGRGFIPRRCHHVERWEGGASLRAGERWGPGARPHARAAQRFGLGAE